MFSDNEIMILKKTDPQKWKEKVKNGGLPNSEKEEMNDLIEKFINSSIGTSVLQFGGKDFKE